ncbi:large subunit ribosomal protein L6 [Ereboglobus sp. PH5-5]|uniref:Large ribosomal subunit protein uL6 n=1 Tax=Ereboglobus luteus TaxID=1796921 RepID=A0A2U8E2N5_9BACT|nr:MULTISPECIES: 50S ribosomal protein L6 [Ereboglobus]AWI09138.1 50S ribosomal protein L6 [Ereboglobus luteus]MDF9826304.1 large subunit ribosomal protein L6 [Ereboglobus sp. PH5-10]MDF9833892.1 large subunit ribosomal protein L6 [Ereboglobus sp. PH5-5]
MSRIGKVPVTIPEKVKVEIKDTTVHVEGPKGKLTKTFAPVVKLENKDGKITVTPVDETRFARSMYGTARAVISNMIKGVTDGYAKELEIQGVGFKAALKGANQLDLALGYSHPIVYDIPEGIKITVTDQTKLKVEGADKQVVGEVTANIRAYYPPEPYKGKGVRIVGEHAERVRRKEGKTVA